MSPVAPGQAYTEQLSVESTRFVNRFTSLSPFCGVGLLVPSAAKLADSTLHKKNTGKPWSTNLVDTTLSANGDEFSGYGIGALAHQLVVVFNLHLATLRCEADAAYGTGVVHALAFRLREEHDAAGDTL